MKVRVANLQECHQSLNHFNFAKLILRLKKNGSPNPYNSNKIKNLLRYWRLEKEKIQEIQEYCLVHL